MKNMILIVLMLVLVTTGCMGARPMPEAMQPDQIKTVMGKVADWQIANPSKHHPADWTHGALYAGMTAWAQMADTDDYYQALLKYAETCNWQPHKRIYHADDHCVGQMYIEMYKKYRDPKMIAGIQERFDYILANQPSLELKFGIKGGQDRWNWCDALFMAPPVWAKLARVTGEQKYLDYMLKEWQATTDYLFDKDEHLYYRDSRYFEQREANGKKVFWSRGNGWSYGGLVRVLEELPEDHPARPGLIEQYRLMSAKLMAILPEDGMWHSSLLDPVSFPTKEASGSGFHCYGLAWGINQGYLDEKTYLPTVMKAWTTLVSCVHEDGMLGYVQPIGADPRQVKPEQTEVYGVGSFLLAGSEVYKIAVRQGMRAKKVVVSNPLLAFRDSETIELPWSDAVKAVPGLNKNNVAVFEFKTNRLLTTQVVEDGKNSKLLWQINLAPGEKKYYWIMKQPENLARPESTLTTFGRYVPERMDDFAWENDKIAFRMYGKALEVETVSSGIDVWCKRVDYPVVNKFYETGDYHEDHGEGGDFYKVGNTLGCGGAGVYGKDGQVHMSRNFRKSKVVANGPIRTIFELSYDPWTVDGVELSEVKRVSIDLGSNLNRIESHYQTIADHLTLAAGIVTDKKTGESILTPQDGWIAYWEDLGKIGRVGCGVVFPQGPELTGINAAGHLLLTSTHPMDTPLSYYAGACWNKVKEFDNLTKWLDYLKAFKQKIDHPVQVEM